jgi:hypothetical protein
MLVVTFQSVFEFHRATKRVIGDVHCFKEGIDAHIGSVFICKEGVVRYDDICGCNRLPVDGHFYSIGNDGLCECRDRAPFALRVERRDTQLELEHRIFEALP